MKKILLSVLLAAAGTASLFAQGTVSFDNKVAFTTPADRFVYQDAVGTANGGKLLVGTQFKAQLYAGVDASSLAPADVSAAFRVPTTTSPGTWSGGTRTIPFTAGQAATLVVRVWDSSTGTTFENATGYKGSSDPFTYVVPPAGSPASAFYMEGLRAFAVVVPEPGTFALAGLGILGLVMARRRK
jgi:hypothetical protein